MTVELRSCACRDCFEITIGEAATLCDDCTGAGCAAWSGQEFTAYPEECLRDGAYGYSEHFDMEL